MIGCSTLLELAQGFGLVTPDPFSSCELGGVWARDYCYGCIRPILDGDQRVCLPIILPDWEVPLQGQEGESVRADSGGSCLANTTMVCSPAIDAIPKTDHSSEVPIPVEKSSQRTSPIDTPAESSHVASVRNSLQGEGISGTASSLILSSWQKATEAAYSCNWRRWE